MPYPRRLLLDDENVVLDLRPHWRRIVLPAIALPVVAGVGAYVAGIGPQAPAYRIGVLVVALLLLTFVTLRPWLRWRATRYVITTRRVVIRSGILRRTGRDVALHRLTDIALDHGIVDRLFRSGDVVLESAGEHGQLVLLDVPHVEDVHRTVYELAEEDDDRRNRGGGWTQDDEDDEDDEWKDQL